MTTLHSIKCDRMASGRQLVLASRTQFVCAQRHPQEVSSQWLDIQLQPLTSHLDLSGPADLSGDRTFLQSSASNGARRITIRFACTSLASMDPTWAIRQQSRGALFATCTLDESPCVHALRRQVAIGTSNEHLGETPVACRGREQTGRTWLARWI